MSGKAKAAAEYTEEFCNAIVTGIDMYLERSEEVLMELSGEYFDEMEPEEMIPFHFDGWGRCVDDVSGADLRWTWCGRGVPRRLTDSRNGRYILFDFEQRRGQKGLRHSGLDGWMSGRTGRCEVAWYVKTSTRPRGRDVTRCSRRRRHWW